MPPSLPPSLPVEVARPFWDVDPIDVDLVQNADYVMERVMLRGGWEAMRWLRATYARAALADFIERKGRRRLSPRELAYWCLIAGLPDVSSQGGGRPPWAGP